MKLNLARVIRQWRWAEKKTLEQAAAEIGISEMTLQRFENEKTPSGETLRAILDWLLRDL